MKFIIDNLTSRDYSDIKLELLILQTPYDSTKKFYIHMSGPNILMCLPSNITKDLIDYSSYKWFDVFKAICKKYAELKDTFKCVTLSIEFNDKKEYKKFINVINANNEKPINNVIGFGGSKTENSNGTITLNVDIVV